MARAPQHRIPVSYLPPIALLCLLLLLSCGKSTPTRPPVENPPGGSADSALCSIDTTNLDFKTVLMGGAASRQFTITNRVARTLSGSVHSLCADFQVLGDTSFALAVSGKKTFVVRFSPTDGGARACSLRVVGANCGLLATGFGLRPIMVPLGRLIPDTLDFGILVPGDSTERSFVLKSVGGDTLRGYFNKYSYECGNFEIIQPRPPWTFSLAPGESLICRVRHNQPRTRALPVRPERTRSRRLQPLGTEIIREDCWLAANFSSGYGLVEVLRWAAPDTSEPETLSADCAMSPAPLDFGAIPVGSVGTRSLQIQNPSSQAIQGALISTNPLFRFELNSNYLVQPGQVGTYTVHYDPREVGAVDSGTIKTSDPACPGIHVVGRAADAACRLVPVITNFSTVAVGTSADRIVTLNNVGTSTVSGTLTTTSPEFTLPGNPAFALAPGNSKAFTVRFQPTAPGLLSVGLYAGSPPCAAGVLYGIGYIASPPGSCAVEPAELNFGAVLEGREATLALYVTNGGSATLTDTLRSNSPVFQVLDSTYTLATGQTAVVRVTAMPPGLGTYSAVVQPGHAACPRVLVQVTGISALGPALVRDRRVIQR